MITLFLTDEDFKQVIVEEVRQKVRSIDIVGVRDIGLAGAKDPTVLEEAARQGRVLLSHDVNTMTFHVSWRLEMFKPMPGVIFVPQSLDIGLAVDDIVYIAEVGDAGELEGQMIFLPL